ncbi:ABC transporter ATP-binding protein [Microvirga pudoricolor]|uniref:ABC transporter ATP-binding protein n=1 Tax=Microvirga pudoricolor TaxID=2778729 RepID=UPI001950EE86|nr:ABC transporter ATP-binding protein [Microvirga pudoricolor]MBM6595602.1 ABC transporter ATP-binding protein [Microvirga pudoricolor]
MMLSCHDLGWSARGTPIVRDVSLAIREGETFGLVGPNGSGKSTLLRLMAGLLEPSQGGVRLKGASLASMPRRSVAQALAFVEQHAESGERITVRDAVELGRTAWLSPLQPWTAGDDAIVARALGDADMTGMEARFWHTLSGGERQRVHLARALAQQPEILLLDEPTNHLDIQHQLAILGLVRQLPITTVIALHDLNQALGCDRLGVMHGGRLVALGPPDEVLTVPVLRDIFGVAASFLIDPADGSRIIRFHPAS